MVSKYVSQKKFHSPKLHLHFEWTLKIAKTVNLTSFWKPEAVKRSYHKWDILSDFQTLCSKMYFTLCKKYSMPDEYQQRLDADAIATLSLFAYYNKLKLTLQSYSEKERFSFPHFCRLVSQKCWWWCRVVKTENFVWLRMRKTSLCRICSLPSLF